MKLPIFFVKYLTKTNNYLHKSDNKKKLKIYNSSLFPNALQQMSIIL